MKIKRATSSSPEHLVNDVKRNLIRCLRQATIIEVDSHYLKAIDFISTMYSRAI